MTSTLSTELAAALPSTSADDDRNYVPATVDAILSSARAAQATDIHLIPTDESLDMFWRIDGILHAVHAFPATLAARIVSRLKVISGLLTYQSETPQEGRVRAEYASVETRVSTFPTLFGEKAVVRLFASTGQLEWLHQLALPEDMTQTLSQQLSANSGVIVMTGPCGSGKTTTVYACLREIAQASRGQRSLCSLEDPIEVVIPGVSQSQVRPEANFNLATGLRSLMRQDPEVIAVGEIRDRETAEGVFQAALTGHLVLTTFHAGSAAGAISRLLDMGIEPYLLRSSIRAVVSQRLVRQLCSCRIECSKPGDLNMSCESAFRAVGCDKCRGTGYSGRIPLAELLIPEQQTTGSAILERCDTATIHQRAVASGMSPAIERARVALESGQTSPEEILRVFGSFS